MVRSAAPPVANSGKKVAHREASYYTCRPNGLTSAPKNFTKITKALFVASKKQGNSSTICLDDSLLLGFLKVDYKKNVNATAHMSEELAVSHTLEITT